LNVAFAAILSAMSWKFVIRDLSSGWRGAMQLWSPKQLTAGLRLGWTMLPVSIAGTAYLLALPAAASAQMDRNQFGLYYLADRLVRALLSAGDPLMQTVYPRIVTRLGVGSRFAMRYTTKWAIFGALLGASLWIMGFLAYPVLRKLLPPDFDGRVLAVLGLLLPILLCWRYFGHLMLGSGRFDSSYRASMFSGCVVGIVGAWYFAIYGALALSFLALGVELLAIVVAVLGVLISRHMDFRKRSNSSD